MGAVGKIHSVQSLGAVDGPGLRYVVFLQGCPLRCAYCHNPDTWDFSGGTEQDSEELVKKILRFRPYFGEKGGVTVTGGEPLMQADFVEDLFQRLKKEGIHTALDTSGAATLEQAEKVLEYTDLVLADLKFTTEDAYHQHCKGSFFHTMEFLALTEKKQIPLWIRHVVAPNLTNSDQSLKTIYQLATKFSNLEKIEWLPYKNLCIEKYQRLGIPFAMEKAEAIDGEQLRQRLETMGIWQI